MRRLLIIAALMVTAGMSACLKKELPVRKHESGNVTTAQVNMDGTYKYQVFYSLQTNSAVGQNLKIMWDLGFETTADGYHVVLNSAKSMFAMKTGKTVFADVAASDTTGFAEHKTWDAPHGDVDSTALGDWRASKPVYIIDLGFDEMGRPQGFRKLQLTGMDNSSYTIRFSKLDGSGDTTMTIAKDTMVNMVSLSMLTKQVVQVEPPKHTWDIVFTQYTYIFWGEIPVTPYLVTGVILNRYNTRAVLDSTNKFDAITYGNISGYSFIPDISAIGYDWKAYNGSTYAIRTRNSYVIRDQRGVYYKLHFTGFYNNSGIKGCPQWEYQEL